MTDETTDKPCTSQYAECSEDDRRCISNRHTGLHMNRAGFAWDDRDAIASAAIAWYQAGGVLISPPTRAHPLGRLIDAIETVVEAGQR